MRVNQFCAMGLLGLCYGGNRNGGRLILNGGCSVHPGGIFMSVFFPFTNRSVIPVVTETVNVPRGMS